MSETEDSPTLYEPILTRPTPRPSHVDVLKHLECPICYDYLEPPVIRCENDHLYCKKCLRLLSLSRNIVKCPQCSVIMSLENEDAIAIELLKNVSLNCGYCEVEFSLALYRKHVYQCLNNPEKISCIFRKIGHFNCKWKENPQRLLSHLMTEHELKEVPVNTTVNYLWDIPKHDKIRIRPRILRVDYPSGDENFSYFLLEHVYKPEIGQLTFMIKSFNKEVKLDYTFFLKDKKNSRTWASFRRQTEDLDGPVLSKFPSCDTKNIVQIDYRHILQVQTKHGDEDFYAFGIVFHID